MPPHLKSVAALPCENLLCNCATLQHVIVFIEMNADEI